MAYITQNDLLAPTGNDASATVSEMPAFKPASQPAPASAPVDKPDTLSTWDAAFREHNLLSAAYDKVTNLYHGSDEFDRNFSPRRQAVADGYAPYQDEFTHAANKEEYDYIKGRVNASIERKKIIDNAGGMGIGASVAASIVDPVSMLSFAIPGIGEARIAQIASAPLRIAARGASYGAAGIGIGIAQDGALSTVRPTSEDESVSHNYGLDGKGTQISMAAGMGLALFGAAGRAVSKASKTAVGKALDSLFIDANGALLPATATDAQRAAATAVNDSASKLYTNAGTTALDYGVSKSTNGIFDGIGMQLMKSPFDAMRTWGQKIAPDIIQRLGTKQGVASPILNAKLMTMMEGNSDIHALGNTLIDTKKALDGLKALTPAEQTEILGQFNLMGIGAKTIDDITPAAIQKHVNELVGYSVATGQKHIIPEIESAAQKMRDMYARDWGRINAQGLTTASGQAAQAAQIAMPNYFTRVFNKQGIAGKQLNFIGDITPHIEQSLLGAGVAPADAAMQARTIAVAAMNKITSAGVAGTGADLLHAMTSAGPMGKLAARTLDVPYAVLAPYLENDAYRVANIYKRSIEPQLALKEVFGHTTFKDFEANVMMPERDRIKQALIDSAQSATGADLARINGELNGFDAAWKDGSTNLEKLFDGMMGRTKMAENAHTALSTGARIARKTVGMAMLSGQVLSSLVDIPRQVGTHGLLPVMGAWGNYLSSKAFREMSTETAERVGVALELTHFKMKTAGNESLNGFDREIPGFTQGSYERFVDRASEKFQWLNGAMAWNDTLRSTTASLAEDRLLRAADTGWANLNKNTREWMLVLGIDEPKLAAIQAAQQGNTQTTRRFMHTDLDHWADLDTARDFKLAVLKDAQTTAATPFQGTMPTWYDTEVGKFLWQFKSFISASYQQTTMVGLQRNDARTWLGLTAMVATGMAISEIKDLLSSAVTGKAQKSKSLEQRVIEGVDRSGAFDVPTALAGYINAAAGSATGHSFAPFDSSNKHPHTWVDMAGPTATVAGQANSAAKEIYNHGMTEKAQQGIASVTPFHKWLGIDVARAVIDAVHGHTQYIDKVSEAFNKTYKQVHDAVTPD